MNFKPLELSFSKRIYSDYDGSCDAFSREIFRFWKYQVVPELYEIKMYEKMAKNRLYEKRCNFEMNEDF